MIGDRSRRETGAYRLFTLTVERLRLYLFRTGVALFVVELAGGPDALTLPDETGEATVAETRAVTLADVQDLNDCLRRAYPPFRDKTSVGGLPRLTPASVRWVASCENGAPPWRGEDMGFDERIGRVWRPEDGARGIAPFQHWRDLAPARWRIVAREGEVGWRHVVDDRMPLTSWISLTNADTRLGGVDYYYRRVRAGDWSRLCYVDGAGGDPWPYASAFLRPLDAQSYYDRYHFQPEETSDPPTRFLVSGYALVAVGCGKFFDETIVIHMRRHYFQMMLLAQFELAALLSLSGRITRAVAAHDAREAADELETSLQNIEEDFLQFVHRFRFTGVSNQLQAQEMFERLRHQMRLPAIYVDVKDELTTATGFLAMRSAARQARAATLLAVIAAFGAVIGLAFAFLGMNVLTDKDFLTATGHICKEPSWGDKAAVVLGSVSAFAALGGLVAHFVRFGPRERGSLRVWLARRLIQLATAAGLAAGLAAATAAGTCPPSRDHLPQTSEFRGRFLSIDLRNVETGPRNGHLTGNWKGVS